MKNFKTLALLAVLSSLSIASWVYAWTYSTSVGNGDLISADKWNSLVAQLIAVSVNPDWNATTWYAQILNKPVIPAAQVNTDWNATSGVAQVLNKPIIPAAQVNSDWNATSGAAQILNKPWAVSGANIYSANTGNVGIGTTAPLSILNVENGGIYIGNSANTTGTNVLINGYGYHIGSTLYGNTSIRSTYSNTSNSASMEFYVASDGSNTSEAMRIAHNGNVGIGTSTPSTKLDVAGVATLASGGTGGRLILGPYNTSGVPWSILQLGTGSDSFRLRSTTDGELFYVSNTGNVGIGITIPNAKLDVAWTIKASKLNVSGGSHFKMNLAHCWGACSWTQPLNTWVSLAGYTWNLVYNTDTSNFVKSGGTVTINEAGVYMLREQAMALPTAATSYMGAAYYCPYINGWANCLGDVWLEHRYSPAGYWSQGRREYVAYLGAWTTIAYGMHTIQTMTNWGYDSYMSLEIIRIN